MPVLNGIKCSLVGSGAGPFVPCGNEKRPAVFKEHQTKVNSIDDVVTCYAEVAGGSLEVELDPWGIDEEYLLVRIAIDDMPRVQRLIPLKHKLSHKLLRFSATEWLEDDVWLTQAWQLTTINLSMLRALKTTAPLSYGNVTVSVYFVSDVLGLEEGAHNHELSSYVTQQAEWKNPLIHSEQYQDDRLTLFVKHAGRGQKITHKSHNTQNYGINLALRHEWTATDAPIATFVFKYREKDKLPVLPLQMSTPDLGESILKAKKGVSSSLGIKRERSSSFLQSSPVTFKLDYSSSLSPEPVVGSHEPAMKPVTDSYDLTTSAGWSHFRKDVFNQRIKHLSKRRKTMRSPLHLRALIADMKAQHQKEQGERLAQLTALSKEVDAKVEEVKELKADLAKCSADLEESMVAVDQIKTMHEEMEKMENEEVQELEKELREAENEAATSAKGKQKAVAASMSPRAGYASSSSDGIVNAAPPPSPAFRAPSGNAFTYKAPPGKLLWDKQNDPTTKSAPWRVNTNAGAKEAGLFLSSGESSPLSSLPEFTDGACDDEDHDAEDEESGTTADEDDTTDDEL